MIRTILTPLNTDLHLSIPMEYVGKRVEVILFTIDEADIPVKKNTMAQYKGILSAETALQMQKHVEQSRNEWERNI